MNKLTLLSAVAWAVAYGITAPAMAAADSAPPAGMIMQMAQAEPIPGEITKIDPSAQKITIRHGPIAKMDMGAMTMVFRVADKAMLTAVQVGDKVNFDVERLGGAMTITRLDKAQ